ncbi:MAG: efflux RND transporter periplasmic adaptor subunit [Gallionellaceae bacterium]|nr:efflux RND transporter periplasmic adaptor subunit [Gallionellaceae bacterium]
MNYARLTYAILVVSLLSACGKNVQSAGTPGPGQMDMPVTVITAKVQRVPVIVEAVGQTEGSKEVEVRARASGILTKQLFNEGDKVQAGATLFTIDRTPYENALAQARASLAQEKANFERAQRETARLKPLVEQKAISQKEYDDTSTARQTSEAALMASEARVREAELNLSYTHVTAPLSGITGRALRSEGSLVVPGNDSGLLTTISVNDPIWVRFSFSESETQKLRQSKTKTEVKLLLPDGSIYEHAGKLNFAASTVDKRTGTVALRAEFPNPNLVLLPGQFVRAQVTTSKHDAFLVPQAALFQSEQGKLVFTVSADNKVMPHPVETSGWLGQDWVVTKGITAGDKIIIDNLMKLRPGAAVAPHAPGENPAGAPPAAAGAPAESGKADKH